MVYRLPSGRGFVFGYADPDNEGAALLCFDTEESEREAALRADRFAEIFAETEREYNTAWQAGRRVEEISEEVKAARKEALAIGAEMRVARSQKFEAPASCAALRANIVALVRGIKKMRKEAASLVSDYGHRPGFVE